MPRYLVCEFRKSRGRWLDEEPSTLEAADDVDALQKLALDLELAGAQLVVDAGLIYVGPKDRAVQAFVLTRLGRA